ncbi:MAG: helix-turn-helix transcriptional regulator [Pseudonocardiales bacterium]|nr:helix-turn-helix transcriptional regulator [Pseudonocardiales bacterium]MBV9028695.1 helix-turn-helix transcriptional regulator [Pseudonocardiales bacterium]
MDPIDPEFFEGDEMRAALAARDIGTVYRLLGRVGVSQRQIAHLTDQSQSEVSEILKGRRVRDVWVLERIADGLGIPRAWMGLSYGEDRPGTASGEVEVSEDMKRRVLVATTSAAALGQVFLGLPELALPTAQALPSRLDMTHVHTVRAVTERLRGVARYYGGQADLFSAAATLYTQWMQVPATDAVTTALAVALAELHTEAGWCSYDAGLDGTGHFTRALRLGGKARDAYGIANTTWHAGMVLVRTGHPNHALKLLQLGGFQLRPHADDSRVPTLTARLARTSAAAYARMGGIDEATRCLAEAGEGWEPRDAFERAGADFVTAGVQRDLGRLNTAEQLTASAVRAYGQGHYRRGHTVAELLLAEIHVRAGEPRGLTLAHQVIETVSTLQSVAARREWLTPLVTALEARPGTDTQELARTARQVATSRIGGL